MKKTTTKPVAPKVPDLGSSLQAVAKSNEAAKKKRPAKKMSKDEFAERRKKDSEAIQGKPNGEDLVPLKKVCAMANVEPRIARRILRAKAKRGNGRWEWPQAEVAKIVSILKGGE